MKPLRVTKLERKTAHDLTDTGSLLQAYAESANLYLTGPDGKTRVVEYAAEKTRFWEYMKRKYDLDPYLEYRININGYLEVERGKGIWLLWEAL